MKACILSPARYVQWKSFILNHKDAAFFHTIKWMKMLKRNGIGDPLYLLLKDDSENIIGIFPLYLINLFPFGQGLTSLTNCNGPLLLNNYDNKKIFFEVFKTLEEKVEKYNVSYLKIRLQNTSPFNSFVPKKYLMYNEYCTFFLDLSEGIEKIFKNRIHKKTRTAIRKAIKLGVEIITELPRMETYWKFYENTMIRNKGIINKNRKNLFKLIWKELVPKKDFITLTAMYKGKPVAGIMGFLFRDKVHVWYNSSYSQFLYLNVNQLLYWKLIEEAIYMGYKHLDFGSTPLNTSEGHYFFKFRFGGKPVPFNDYVYFHQKLRCLLIEKGVFRVARKFKINKKLPYAILKKFGKRKIF